MKFLQLNFKINNNNENLCIPHQNHENHEILKIPVQNNEKS